MEKIQKIEDIEMEIMSAIFVLKMLPREGPRKMKSSWPFFVMLEIEKDEKAQTQRSFRVSKAAIDDMDIVFEDWFKVLDYDEKKLVFYKNSGVRWKTVVRNIGHSRSWLNVKYRRSIKKIYDYVLEKQAKSESAKALT